MSGEVKREGQSAVVEDVGESEREVEKETGDREVLPDKTDRPSKLRDPPPITDQHTHTHTEAVCTSYLQFQTAGPALKALVDLLAHTRVCSKEAELEDVLRN